MNQRVFAWVEPILAALRRYHSHEVRGLEHVPASGRALIVINHSLATYDALLLGHAVHERTGRFTRGLADRLMFRMPLVRTLATALGIKEGTPENGRGLLAAGELVMVAPGGMREALRPSTESFEIDWSGRLGFVRLAVETRTPIILAACPMADWLYDVYDSWLTSLVYERFRFPLPFARGIGPTALPRPIRLVHLVSKPIRPPRDRSPAGIEKFHAEIVERMEILMREALGDRPKVMEPRPRKPRRKPSARPPVRRRATRNPR